MLDAGSFDAGGNDAGSAIDMSLPDAAAVDSSWMRAQVLATIPALGVATVGTGGGGIAVPDYACRGAWDQTDDGDDAEGIFNFDYGGAINTTVDIKFFPANAIPYDRVCTGDCFTRQATESGSTSTFPIRTNRFMAWASPQWTAEWGSVYVPTATYFVRSEQFIPYNYRTTVPDVAEMQDLYSRSGMTYDANVSTLTGSVQDCDGLFVRNAAVRVFEEAGTLRNHLSAPYLLYGSLSTATQSNGPVTREDGHFVGVNAQPLDARGSLMRLEAWANLGSGSPELLACERVRVFGGTLIDVPLRPRRIGSPSDCTP
jgi:hypothetical protein